MKDISIPYYSRISDSEILQISRYSNNIERLALKSDLECFESNDMISDVSLAKVVILN